MQDAGILLFKRILESFKEVRLSLHRYPCIMTILTVDRLLSIHGFVPRLAPRHRHLQAQDEEIQENCSLHSPWLGCSVS